MSEKVVRASELNPDFKFEIAETYEGRTVLWCVQCGMCTSNCPFSEALDVKPHQVVKRVLLGMRDSTLSCETIWICSSCFMCDQRCPQGVELGNVMFALKNMASVEKGVPEGLEKVVLTIMDLGRTTEVTDFENEERLSLGLPSAPRVDADAIRRLLRKTDVDKIVGREK